MEMLDFEKIRDAFQQADVDGKIEMYVSTEGLTQMQYRDLLKFFPVSEIPKLEKALDM